MLPSNLYGADWLQLRNKSVADKISFTAKEDLDLFIAAKQSVQQPTGAEFTKTEIITDEAGGTSYNLYRKRLLKDQTTTVELNQHSLLAFLPVNNMQPAYDLKPVTPYRTNVAIIGEGLSLIHI